uniref:Uncharacterized protein n=1 Tax=Caenorhabditis japonica TaxID=281687 RepID=A0A8R1I4S5_CAEJA
MDTLFSVENKKEEVEEEEEEKERQKEEDEALAQVELSAKVVEELAKQAEWAENEGPTDTANSHRIWGVFQIHMAHAPNRWLLAVFNGY